MKDLAQLTVLIEHELWEKKIETRPAWQRFVVSLGRLGYGIARKFVDHNLSMRAMSLVYTSLLSLVPLLAVSFAVLRAFGVHNQIEPMLLEFLDPLGDKKAEITRQIVEFVENLRLGVLNTFGMIMLIYTVISMTHKVEQTFNGIWQVTKPRSIARQFSDYLSVILIGPVLVFSGLSMTQMALDSQAIQWIASIEPLGTLLYDVSKLFPYIIVCCAFAFVYGFIPNTRVKFTSAIIGGVFSGGLWSAASVIFANLVVDSSSYSAIYAGFASIVLFMVWVYLGWMIILVGAQVTFYWQNWRFLDPRLERSQLNSREREEVALDLITLIGKAYQTNQPLWTRVALESARPSLQPDLLRELLRLLVANSLLAVTRDDPAGYLPARDIATISVQEVITLIRGTDVLRDQSVASVNAMMDQIDAAIESTLRGKTIKDLIESEPSADAHRPGQESVRELRS